MGEAATIPATAPAPRAPAVRAHRQMLEIERDALRASAVELALRSALGDPTAKAALAALPGKIAALTLEIDLNAEAHERQQHHDSAAEVAWRESIQTLPPEEIIFGLAKESCCVRCQPGARNGCVISAGAAWSGGTCAHPLKERDTIFSRDEHGVRQFLYRASPQAARVFEAALKKLGVER